MRENGPVQLSIDSEFPAQTASRIRHVKKKPCALFVLDPGSFDVIYGPEEIAMLEDMLDFPALPMSKKEVLEDVGVLEDVEILMSGWGAPLLDSSFLRSAPKLKAIFYGAGSIRAFTTPEFWKSGVRITSAYEANAVPVAEYTLATILLSLTIHRSTTASAVWRIAREAGVERRGPGRRPGSLGQSDPAPAWRFSQRLRRWMTTLVPNLYEAARDSGERLRR